MEEYSGRHDLDDEQLGHLIEKNGQLLREGEKPRREIIRTLAGLLAADEATVGRTGPLGDSGRVSFGRENEGRSGVSLYISDDSGSSSE